MSDTNLSFFCAFCRKLMLKSWTICTFTYCPTLTWAFLPQVDVKVLDNMQFYILSDTNLSFFMHFARYPTPICCKLMWKFWTICILHLVRHQLELFLCFLPQVDVKVLDNMYFYILSDINLSFFYPQVDVKVLDNMHLYAFACCPTLTWAFTASWWNIFNKKKNACCPEKIVLATSFV